MGNQQVLDIKGFYSLYNLRIRKIFNFLYSKIFCKFMGEIKNVPFLKKYLFQCPTYIFCDFSLLFYHYKNIFLHYTYNIFLNFYFSHNGDEIFFSRSGINVVQEYMMMSYTNCNLIFKIKSRHTACFIILYRCPCKLEYDTAV